jgi:hypothetical protein
MKSIPKKINEILKNKGGLTKYWIYFNLVYFIAESDI